MTYNHSQTISTIFLPDQNNLRNPPIPKSSQIGWRRLMGVHHRQTIQTKPRKLVSSQASLGR